MSSVAITIIEYESENEGEQTLNIDEEDPADRIVSEHESDITTGVTKNIKLPSQEPRQIKRQSSSDSSTSDSDKSDKKVPTPKPNVVVEPSQPPPSGSSSPSSRRSDIPEILDLPLVIPPIPDDVPEEEIISGADDIELENGWRRNVKLSALQRTRLIERATIDKYLVGDISRSELVSSLNPFLIGEEPIAGIVMMDTGEKKSIYKAAKEGYIPRGTAISILEAQAATGNIIG